MRFEFATAGRILFGPGAREQLGPLARALGARALVVTGRSLGRAQVVLEALASQRLAAETHAVAGEPTLAAVLEGAEKAKRAACDLVVGFGGGSALDAAKAIAALATNPGDIFDYLEVIGRGRPFENPPLPCVAIPTTAGTGTEVTRNAVLASPEHRVKASLRSPQLLPRVAIVDPWLCRGLPPALTATTGLDALTQLVEPYVCVRTHPMVDALCLEGLRRVARSLRRACADGADMEAREDMSLASLFSGLALANAGLGAVHGLAAPIGGMFPAPHGAVCAALLPWVMEANLRALRARLPGSEACRRYDHVARALTARPDARAEEGVAWVRELCAGLSVPPLRAHGLTTEALPAIVEKALQASSMKANPIALTQEELSGVLEQVW